MKALKASQIMTQGVVIANIQHKYSEVMNFFVTHKLRHLPVVIDNKLAGIITKNDMLKFISQMVHDDALITDSLLDRKFKVEDVMTPNPVCVTPFTPIDDILAIMSEGKFQAIPVAECGYIQGIISTTDLVWFYDWERKQEKPDFFK